MDIHNDWSRPVICVENDLPGMSACSENAKMLTVGKIYTVIDVEVDSWYTLVRLKEFPGYQFNSVQFEELDDERLLDREEANSIPTRDELLVTAGARAAYMHCRGDIELASGLEGEIELANFISRTIHAYMKLEDTNFDLYIEEKLLKEFGNGN